MTDTTAELPFASEFPAATREAWLKVVEGVLKGAPFDKRLIGATYDGIKIQPVYPRDAKAAPIAGRAAGAPWHVMQRVDNPQAAAANTQALEDLANGATGLSLVFAGSIGARGLGLPASGEALSRASSHACASSRQISCRSAPINATAKKAEAISRASLRGRWAMLEP